MPSSEIGRIRDASGDRSPIARDELAAKEVTGIVDYLGAWKPSDQFGGPSAEGLAVTLGSLVANDPDRFAASAHKFEGANPVYVEALIDGLRHAIENGKLFPWR